MAAELLPVTRISRRLRSYMIVHGVYGKINKVALTSRGEYTHGTAKYDTNGVRKMLAQPVKAEARRMRPRPPCQLYGVTWSIVTREAEIVPATWSTCEPDLGS